MSRYEIAFAGRLVPGADLAQVKTHLARLFQADAARIELLFSGRRMVIKSELDAEGAEKYRTIMARAGAVAEVRALEALVEEIELGLPPAAPEPAMPVTAESAAPTGSLKVAPRDEYMAAFSDVQAPDFGIAPIGVDLQDAKPEPVAPTLDLSQLSLAPVGSDMGQSKVETAALVPDTSHLRVL